MFLYFEDGGKFTVKGLNAAFVIVKLEYCTLYCILFIYSRSGAAERLTTNEQ